MLVCLHQDLFARHHLVEGASVRAAVAFVTAAPAFSVPWQDSILLSARRLLKKLV